MSDAPDPRLGTTLNDRYRVVRKIGAGGMGIVYEGKHLLIQRQVAIKMLHPQFSQHAEVLTRFKREAIAATTIRHPHIVEVIDMGTAPDGAAYMVLEYLEGRDWSDDMESAGAQPLGRVIRIMRQICEGVQAAHDKNVVHRDLKAENVFLAKHGSATDYVKIVDFGISKMLDDPDAPDGKSQHALTKTGAAMGTPYAMAPEQMRGSKGIDHRVDLWALGVMLYRGLSGAYPFDGATMPVLAVNVLTADPAPLSVYRTDLPPRIQEIVSRLLEKDPAHRLQHARELRDALAPFEVADAAPQLATPAAFAMGETMSPPIPRTHAGTSPAPRIVAAAPTPSMSASPSSLEPNTQLAALASVGRSPAPTPADASSITRSPADRPSGAGSPGMITGVLLTVVLMTLGGVGVVFGMRMIGGERMTGAPPPSTQSVVEGPTAPVPSSVGLPSSPIATVAIHIAAVPESAEILVDGNPLSNPVDVDLPSSADVHSLEVRADGYVTSTRQISAAFPQRISVVLDREPSGGHVRRPILAPTTTSAPPPETSVAPPPSTTVSAPPEVHADPPPSTTSRGLRSPFGH